jgi:hypothetical protein
MSAGAKMAHSGSGAGDALGLALDRRADAAVGCAVEPAGGTALERVQRAVGAGDRLGVAALFGNEGEALGVVIAEGAIDDAAVVEARIDEGQALVVGGVERRPMRRRRGAGAEERESQRLSSCALRQAEERHAHVPEAARGGSRRAPAGSACGACAGTSTRRWSDPRRRRWRRGLWCARPARG